jgi:hypothetical protein
MSMLGEQERPALKLKAKETEGLLEFAKSLLETYLVFWGGNIARPGRTQSCPYKALSGLTRTL